MPAEENINQQILHKLTDNYSNTQATIQGLTSIVATLTKNQETISAQHGQTEKTLAVLTSKIDSHFATEASYQESINNLNTNINEMKITVGTLASLQQEKIDKALNPAYELIRQNRDEAHKIETALKDEMEECAEKIEKRIKDDAKSHLAVLWACLGIIGILVGYVYLDIKEDINKNSERLELYANNIRELIHSNKNYPHREGP